MKSIRNIFCIVIGLALFGCSEDFLDLRPKDKVDAKALFAEPEGVKLYLANLIPIAE
jgi:hypothetical protein